jgi:hypothetical protein
MKKLPSTSLRLLAEIAANPSIRWFDQFATVNGWPALDRAGLVVRDGSRAKLTPAGIEYARLRGWPVQAEVVPEDKLHLQVGQLWEVGGKLYRIDSMDGPDKCYPIIMPEVARDPKINREIEQRAKSIGEPLNAHTLLTLKPIGMTQERAWFNRPDVKPWTGTLLDWKRHRGA